MKSKTSLPELPIDSVGVYNTIYENQNDISCDWTSEGALNIRTKDSDRKNGNSSVSFTFNNHNQHDLHPIFTELAILYRNDNRTFEWRETARWIKFEETVENGGNRWSKPYVGTIMLQSLIQLKQLLLNSNLMLDVEAQNMEAIVKLIGENLVYTNMLSPEQRNIIKNLLLQPHCHQYELIKGASLKRDMKENKKFARDELVLQTKQHGNKRFLRKIPVGAEACNILVGKLEFLKKPLTIFLRLKEAIVINQLTEVPVPTRFLFILLGPNEKNYKEIGRSMAALMSDQHFRFNAYHSKDSNTFINSINHFLNTVLIIPPTLWDASIRIEPPANITTSEKPKGAPDIDDDTILEDEEEHLREESGLIRTGRLFGGLLNDIKRKAPWYWSDFYDALNMQCIASWIFLYFACLSPIITFGGLLSEATGKNIAAIESLASGFICGIVYGLFSGQPLAILGSTGPVLVFESIVYEFCQNQGWDYLTFRFWIGTWIAIILLLLTAFDASATVCYITRFTEENFATLIAFIFIYKAIENVVSINNKYPVNSALNDCICITSSESDDTELQYNQYKRLDCLVNNGTLVGSDCSKPDTANIFLMSIILFLGTFLISIILKEFKNALFFPTVVRQFISDFAVIIAIFSMSTLDFFMEVATQKLEVPTKLEPTLPTRGWLIPAFHINNPTWTSFAAVIPALLGTILIFMDQQITAVIINRKENKLKKGCGYHLDLFILSILIQTCTIMGLPWFVAATILSLNHVNSLKKETESSAPGEKPQFLGIHEQRVTQILIFLTIGLSVFLMPILRHIPMPVLFGVFLYMGVASLKGLQFYDRILIVFMPAKYQPDYPYLRQVPIQRVHLFTIIQLACLIALWIIKSFSQTSILFPLMLVVMIGIRKLLDYVFTQRELKILDDIMPGMSKSHQSQEGTENKGFENVI